jgi:putative ABC transport system permease protein
MRWWQQKDREREIERELRSDLELEADEQREKGLSPEQARYAALRAFGNTTLVKEEVREVWSWGWIERFFQDVRFGFRMMRRNPGFTLVAASIFAIGIAANSAIFSVVNAVLLQPLPYRDADRLVQIWETNPQANRWGQWVSYPDYLDWREQSRVCEDMAAFRPWPWRITGGDHAEMLTGFVVTSNFLALLDVQPMFGRSFLPGEDEPGRDPVVLLGYGLWQRRFASDQAVLGQTVTLDGQQHTVIGVMPSGFEFPREIGGGRQVPDVYVPVGSHPDRQQRGSHNFRVIARLKPGATIEQAQADMESVAAEIGERHPDHRDRSAAIAGLQRNSTREVRPALLLLLGAIGFVLLIACTNIAGLQLARATTRQREVAVRQALGASRSRLIVQLLTENVIVAILGGAAGLVLAHWATQSLIRLAPQIPRLEQTATDPIVVAFTLLLATATGVLSGLAPAFQGCRADLNEGLKDAGSKSTTSRARAQTRNVLVVAEMALAVTVLVGATLFLRSYLLLQNIDLGFRPRNVLTAYLGCGERGPSECVAFFKEVVDRIGVLPGVEAAGAASAMPFRGNDNGPFEVEGQSPERSRDGIVYAERPKVTPQYLRAMGIPLLNGRHFTWADNQSAPLVAIVSEALARRYWPREDPVGKRVSVDARDGKPVWRQIIGVAKDTRHDDLTELPRPVIYLPLAQSHRSFLAVAVRTRGVPSEIAAAVRRIVTSVSPDQPLFQIETLEHVVSESLASRRFQTLLLGIFGAAALILAAAGIYAVASFSVSQRRRETAIRMALGARRNQVLGEVLRHGLTLASLGAAIGVVGALALSRVLSGMLYGIAPTDLVTFTVIPSVLIAVALLACYLPARRAARVDPMTALRCE